MKKRLGNVNVSISNRAFYSVLLLSISILVVSVVFAFGTSTPASFGHSAKELDLSSGVEGNAVFLGSVNVSGNIKSNGNIDSGNSICVGGNCITSWSQVNASGPSGGGSYTGNLVNSVHTGTNCVSANGIPTEIQGGIFVCKFISGACPSGWTQYQKWSTTYPSTCDGGGAICGISSVCSTGGHVFSNKTTESCTYTQLLTGPSDCQSETRTCGAGIQEIGCF